MAASKHLVNKTIGIMVLLLCALKTEAQHTIETFHYITTDDHIKLYAEKSGTGPVCIFIHGGPGVWSKSFKDLGGSNLETRLTMIYYDQRGSGRSDNSPNGDYSLDRMLKEII